jgi:hypothetical protein
VEFLAKNFFAILPKKEKATRDGVALVAVNYAILV